jgi:TolB-like protein/Tfp pilus assembly protein PilF
MGFRDLIAELRRRHVFRVAAWYGAVAWLLIQVAATTFPSFELPPWTVRAVIALCLLGFPIALLLAWAFQVTPEGLQRSAPSVSSPAPATPLWRSGSLWLGLAAGALLGFGAFRAWLAYDAPAERPGIAVLAFDVLGVEANRPLAGGLHEAVLNELAGISGLRVIARTSVLRFADQQHDLREVGHILGVPFVLEGSVLREGGRLRVHAQLIDAATNEHVWSETYERAADDIFGVQTALARDIAARLRVTLLPAEAARASQPPTMVGAAYDAFLRGVAGLSQHDQLRSNEVARSTLQAALSDLDAALRIDPGFALAYAERSRALTTYWYHHRDEAPGATTAREQALADATEALRLAPRLGEAHRALGLYYYWGHFDFPRAERELALARELLPNDAISPYLLGLVRRRQGRFDESVDLFAHAYRIDPTDRGLQSNYVGTLFGLKRYAEAEQVNEDRIGRFPGGVGYGMRAILRFCRSGDARVFDEIAAQYTDEEAFQQSYPEYLRWYGAMLSGRYADALSIVATAEGEQFGIIERSLAKASAEHMLGDTAAAAATLAALIKDLERRVAAGPPERVGLRDGLALALALAGRDADARATIEAHLANSPLARSALDHWTAVDEAAQVYALLGDVERSLALLTSLQRGQYSYCGNGLRRLPEFTRLRGDPRLEALAKASDP